MNIKGCYYLLLKEIKRFLAVWIQTLLGPVVVSLLFLFIFIIAIGRNNNFNLSGVPLLAFLLPGVIMMQVTQNAFANSSSSVMVAKIFGTINDIIVAPLSSCEIALAWILGSVLRGVIITILCYVTCYLIFRFQIVFTLVRGFLTVYFLFVSAFIMGAVGLLAGLWSASFDKLSAVTNLIIMPLTFLSGTFYSVKNLPHSIYLFVHFNPIFYMIDGFRYALSGVNDFNIYIEGIVLFIIAVTLYIVCVALIKSGYRIKS